MKNIKTQHRSSGRRKAVDIDSPRDKTVCFMVSEEEKQSIDHLCVSLGKTRSSILTRIVTSFLCGVTDRDRAEDSIAELKQFLEESQTAFAKHDNKRTKI